MTDTSKEYIVQCDHPLVQERRHRKEGGWWAWRKNMVPQVYANCGTCHETIMAIGTDDEAEYIYLPDQRALQEWTQLVEYNIIRHNGKIYELRGWLGIGAEIDINVLGESVEQCLLRAFMDTVHKLQWEGGKWQKK